MIYLPHAVPKRKQTKRSATKWSHQKRLTSLRKNGNDNDHDDDVADNDDDDGDGDGDGNGNDDGKWNAVPKVRAKRWNAVLICVQGWGAVAQRIQYAVIAKCNCY